MMFFALLAGGAFRLFHGDLVETRLCVPVAILCASLAHYFVLGKPGTRRTLVPLAGLFAIGVAWPFLPAFPKDAQTVVLTNLHLVGAFLALVGVAYLGTRWRDAAARVELVRFAGDVAIFSTIIMLGGMVLTMVTLQLFSLVHVKIEEWYFRNIVVLGAVAVPFVASDLVEGFPRARQRIAPALARTFLPRVSVTMGAFFVVASSPAWPHSRSSSSWSGTPPSRAPSRMSSRASCSPRRSGLKPWRCRPSSAG